MAPKDETNETPATGGAWQKDQEIGNVLGQTFTSEGEGSTFLLLGALPGSTVKTRFGDAESIKMLVRKIDKDGNPEGPAFEVSTVESSIVSKLQQAGGDDFPAIVRYHEVPSKQAGGGIAHVLTFVRKPGGVASAELLERYGVQGDGLLYGDDLKGMGVNATAPVAGEVG